MPPELMPQQPVDPTPILEAIIVQNKQNAEAQQATLEALVVQGIQNNPTPAIEEGNAINAKNAETLQKISETIESGNETVAGTISELKQNLETGFVSTVDAVKTVVEELAKLSEEVKKKSQDELYLDLDPNDFKGEPGEKGDPGETGATPAHRWNGTKLQLQKSDGTWGDEIDLKGMMGDTPEAGVDYQIPKDGKPGEKGEIGPMPKHEWNGWNLRFEMPNGEWGPWVSVRGPKGEDGKSGGGGGPNITIQRNGVNITEVAKDINFTGAGVSVTNTGNTTVVNIPGGVDESLAIAYAVAL